MKKLAIGCGIIVLLIGVAVVGAGYYAYRKVGATVAQFSELAKIPEIERQVRNTSTFAPPQSGEITASQLDRFLQVQTRVHDRLGANVAAFERTYKTLTDKKDATVTDVPALLSAYKDLAAMWLDAKRTQVQALNDGGLSLDEYRWIRGRAYQAIGAPFVDVDFARLAEQAKQGISSGMPAASLDGGFGFTGEAPAANVKLVEKFKKQLQDNIALATFGL
jgi:hypothetical protein